MNPTVPPLDEVAFAIELHTRLGRNTSDIDTAGLAVEALDSLERVEIASWLEDLLGTEFSDVETSKISSAADFYSLYKSHFGRPVQRMRMHESARPVAGRSQSFLNPPDLSGERVRLEPMTRERLSFVYHLSTTDPASFRWRYRGRVPTPEAFEAEFMPGVLTHFVAVEARSGTPAGYLVCYNRNAPEGYAYLGVVFADSQSGSRVPLEASDLFLRHLFWTYNLRKLYLEIPEYNYDLIRSGAGRYFDVEGRLHEHDYYALKYWDQYILAIYPDHLQGLPRYRSRDIGEVHPNLS